MVSASAYQSHNKIVTLPLITIYQAVNYPQFKKTKKTLAESQSITTFAAESWQSGRLRQS